MNVPSLFVLLLLAPMILAGCMGPEAEPPTVEAPPDGEIGPPLPPTNPVAEDTLQMVEAKVVGLVVITEPTENRTVRIHHQIPSEEDASGCRQLIDATTLSDETRFFYAVWNRTGITAYHERFIHRSDVSEPFTVTLQLPEDPPYLIQTSMCTIWPYVEFHATDWMFAVQGASPYISSRDEIVYNVTIPVGDKKGSAGFNLEGELYFVESKPAVDPKRGLPYGDYYFYEPGNSGQNWSFHGWIHPGGDSSIESTRIIWMPKPGEYVLEVELDAPAPTETVWQGHNWVYRFHENVTRYGFEFPFERYV